MGNEKNRTSLKGTVICPGVVCGQVHIHKPLELEVERGATGTADEEWRRYVSAVQAATIQLNKLIADQKGAEESDILTSHCMLLEDPELDHTVREGIMKEAVSAEFAVSQAYGQLMTVFQNMDNPLFQQRAADVEDVSRRLIRILKGVTDTPVPQKPVMIVATDLTPSELAEYPRENMLGMILEEGGTTSHVSIMASAWGIPTMIGVSGAAETAVNGCQVLMNTLQAEVILSPDAQALEQAEIAQRQLEEITCLREACRVKSATTLDGYTVELACNIGSPNDCEGVLAQDGEGIGLFRTEFLFIDRPQMPSEEQQYEAYRQTLQNMKGKKVVFRTLDAGGDKHIPYLGGKEEENPFLGHRAIRLCLAEQDLFCTQLRAILRASVHGPTAIMFPMIATLEELRQAKQHVENTRRALLLEGIAVSADLEIGMMIELPAAAIQAADFVGEVDFFSIGTNDLTQYTMAADRGNPAVRDLYSPYQPAVLRLIDHVIRTAGKAGIWVGICGESAGDPLLIPLFLAMGVTELSMSAGRVLAAKQTVRSLSRGKSFELLEAVRLAKDKREILSLLQEFQQ